MVAAASVVDAVITPTVVSADEVVGLSVVWSVDAALDVAVGTSVMIPVSDMGADTVVVTLSTA